ncbi:hypothetical protein D3C83_315010 [compost metagenome]
MTDILSRLDSWADLTKAAIYRDAAARIRALEAEVAALRARYEPPVSARQTAMRSVSLWRRLTGVPR